MLFKKILKTIKEWIKNRFERKKILKVIKKWFGEDINSEEQKKLIELYETIKKEKDIRDEIKESRGCLEQEATYIYYNLMNYRSTKKYEYAQKAIFAKAKYDLAKEYFDF